MQYGGFKSGELQVISASTVGEPKMKHITTCKCLECHKAAIKELLSYFTSGNSIEVDKVTLSTKQIKEMFGNLFPNHKFTKDNLT